MEVPSIQEINKKPKGRYSLPKDPAQRQTGKKDPIAYVIKDKAFGEFAVFNTANGWWSPENSGQGKVERLIDAYKIDANDDEACFYAGITIEQLRYFKELHKDFYRVKHACGQNLGLVAKQKFAKEVEASGAVALEYLKMKRKDEGYTTRTEQTGANGRDLFEAMAKELKELGEAIANGDDTKEHPSDREPAGDLDAGQDGAGHEAGLALSGSKVESVPA